MGFRNYIKLYIRLVRLNATYQTQQRVPDFRRYEIKDHLGNVRTVIADYKNPFTTTGSINSWTYLANVKNISNMYPYGKSYGTNAIYNATDDYRYGFNGMEKEKNLDKSGDITDFGARVFDANFPVFLSPDPMENIYSYQSTYIFAKNNPIKFIDLNGEHYHDGNTKFFNAKNSFIVLKWNELTLTHKNAIYYLIRNGYDLQEFEDVELYETEFSGFSIFNSTDPNFIPNRITLKKGPRAFNKNNAPMPEYIKSSNSLKIKPLILLGLVAEAVAIAADVVKLIDSFEMKEAKLQNITLKTIIPDVLNKAGSEGLLSGSSAEDIDQVINLLMYGQSEGANQNQIDMYHSIVDQIIEPNGITLIENTSGGATSDATKVNKTVKIPTKSLRKVEKKE